MCLVLIVAGTLLGGCSTPSVHDAVHSPPIIVTESGTVLINNRPVDVADVARELKAAGYRKSSEILILIPASPDRAVMKQISIELAKKGFTRTVFVTKRTASATIVNPQ